MITFNHSNGIDVVCVSIKKSFHSIAIKNNSSHLFASEWFDRIAKDIENDHKAYVNTDGCATNWCHRVWSFELSGSIVVVTNKKGCVYMYCKDQAIRLSGIDDIYELRDLYLQHGAKQQ